MQTINILLLQLYAATAQFTVYSYISNGIHLSSYGDVIVLIVRRRQ
jgi:hypothetical protein